MGQIWVYSFLFLNLTFFMCLNCGCNSDDSCGYDVVGYVKSERDSMPLSEVKVKELHYNFGDKKEGQDSISHSFRTDSNGKYSYEGWLIPQRTYSCPSAGEIELRFRYEKTGFATIDSVFAKGAIVDGGTGERGKTILSLPTIYLKQL